MVSVTYSTWYKGIIMQHILKIRTDAKEGLFDITREVESVVKEAGIECGVVHIYVRGATAGIRIQEN